MIRVYVLVEGQTEEAFVKNILQGHFNRQQIYLFPILSGGIKKYPRARRDILAALKSDTGASCTTMFDYYGMPNNWPNRKAAGQRPHEEKAVMIERAILEDISAELGTGFNSARFVPYVQMHEFEALLFSDPKLLADGLDLTDATATQSIRGQFRSPEEINDSQQTAPSKRIIQLCPSYDKRLDGLFISQRIGLEVMRAECSHFDEWIQTLEALAHH
ncbi:MAG: DUF4276 family protein [Sedimentisphaerales bacterium]|nr:DUF4276 family protein [Sedimentisphaerales bacterium]